jgi:hypothetical protein
MYTMNEPDDRQVVGNGFPTYFLGRYIFLARKLR